LFATFLLLGLVLPLWSSTARAAPATSGTQCAVVGYDARNPAATAALVKRLEKQQVNDLTGVQLSRGAWKIPAGSTPIVVLDSTRRWATPTPRSVCRAFIPTSPGGRATRRLGT
jgi:hypothetical protein